MASENNKVITLICERAADVNDLLDDSCKVQGVDGLHAIKLPCSGMIQASMIEAALKAGASGVIVCGCQIGDCYYREGNKMIRERLLGERPPGLKKAVDRRRVMALWLSRLQKDRFLSEANQFVQFVATLEPLAAATPAPAAKAAPAAATAAAPKEAQAKKKAEEAKPTAEEPVAADEKSKSGDA